MKNKNTVIALLIVFTGICLYHLFFAWQQSRLSQTRDKYESVLSDFAKVEGEKTPEDSLRWLEASEYLEDGERNVRLQKAKDRSFSLGLDLQGGMFVTLEVSMEQLLQQLAGSSREDPNFIKAMAAAKPRAQVEEKKFVNIFLEELEKIAPNANLGAMFSNKAKNIGASTPKDAVADMLRQESEDAVDRTFEIIRKRVDQFGVVSPNLQKQEITGRILLELPGVKDPERVRKLLRSTARLEFWETHTVAEVYPDPGTGRRVLEEINDKLKVMYGLADSTELDSAATDSLAALTGDGITQTGTQTIADGGTATLNDSSDLNALDGGGEEQLSGSEALAKVKRENPLFYRHLIPPDGQRITANSPIVGYARPKDTAAINKIFNMPEIKPLIPNNMRFAWTFKPIGGDEDRIYALVALKPNRRDSAVLDGGVITNATQDFDQYGNAVVSMTMNKKGRQEWARITEKNVDRSVAITLDGHVYTYPNVNEKIAGGRSQISGDFDVDEAKDLATVLKAGQLPVRTKIESEDLVGPTLGRANIRSGFRSFIGAFIITLIFMAIYYAKSGLIANIALIANLIFIMGCSAAFTIVLTLPGIAALVLTVGMAVDANVLIFERIREEQAKGKTLKASIKAGFSNAFSSVMDANITTFLTGVVLYAFGVGPIRGFAVTLMIGIVTSLISALIITRLILEYYADKGGESIKFGFPWTTGLFDRIKLYMVERRKRFYMLSGIAILVALISMATIGFKTGVDFQGGRQFRVAFVENGQPSNLSDAQIEEIRGNLATAFGTEPVVKTMSAANQLQITISKDKDDAEATEAILGELGSALKKTFPGYDKEWIQSSSMIGPTLADDIRDAALYSVIFSLIIIFLYILIRFRKWQYSAGAIAAIFHDVIIVLGVFSLLSAVNLSFFSVEINQAFIAALLTIIGYSINDTVVVFDRIRENIGEMKSATLEKIYDVSIDQTISRTLITSVTTLLTAIILFIFGGDVIRGFVFGIIIGIIVGTYSSIFVASPISLDLIRWWERRKANRKQLATN